MSPSCFHRPSVLTVSLNLSRTTFITWLLYILTLNGEVKIILSVSSINVYSYPMSNFPWNVWIFPFPQWSVTWENGPFVRGTRRINTIYICHSVVEPFPLGPDYLYGQQLLGLKISSSLGTGQEIMTLFTIMTMLSLLIRSSFLWLHISGSILVACPSVCLFFFS